MNKNLEVETVTATGANGKDGKIGINGKEWCNNKSFHYT